MNPGARSYLIVTASYWGFTLVDGALRMLVLFHFFKLGYSPFTLAFLFLLYEFAGIVANLSGGWFATRYGIPRMLAIGQGLQVAGLLMLSFLNPAWTVTASVAYVVAAQGIAGLAKDFTKTASKSAIKATSGEGSGQLFKWVAYFTGSKNAMKGVGFFFGGLLLDLIGFQHALWLMAAIIGVIFVGSLVALPRQLGKAKSSKSMREFFAKSRGVNLLAAARVVMFGAREVWFMVGVPVFLYAAGWKFLEVGGFLAAWTIAYGIMQALAPALVARSTDGLSTEVRHARIWAAILFAVPVILALALRDPHLWRPDLVLVIGLSIFGLPFAVNSSLHSYLILAYAGSEKAAEDVGFYYAANAAGRLLGILLSGVLYQAGGITACLAGSAVMLLLSWATTFLLPLREMHTAAPKREAALPLS